MTRRRPGRSAEVLRVAVGIGHAVRVVRGRRPPVLDTVLAVRQLGQAFVVSRSRSADAHTASAAVDVAHAVTMVPLALTPRWRGFAVGQLWVSLVLALAEIAAVGSGRRR